MTNDILFQDPVETTSARRSECESTFCNNSATKFRKQFFLVHQNRGRRKGLMPLKKAC